MHRKDYQSNDDVFRVDSVSEDLAVQAANQKAKSLTLEAPIIRAWRLENGVQCAHCVRVVIHASRLRQG